MRKNIAQLVGGNFLSKIIGFIREILVAAFLGTGSAIGAYRIAQTGTLLPINFFTSDSLNSAFIPLYKRLFTESVDKAQSLLWALLVLFSILSSLLLVVLWQVGHHWVAILAPGLDTETSQLANSMLQVMGLGVPFYLLSALLIFLGMAKDDFVPMAVRPSVQNIGLLVGTALAFILHNALFLAWGFTASYIVFCCWVVARMHYSAALRLPTTWQWLQLRQIISIFWKTLRPLLLLPLMLQGNIAIERAVATLIGLVTVSALDYARFITETMIFLVSMPVAFAGLSNWSCIERHELRKQLVKVVELMLIVSVPASIFLAIHAETVVALLYHRGAFDDSSLKVTSDILFGISLGLWAQVIGYVLIKALNAQLNNRVVMIVMTLALSANALVNIFLYPYMGAFTLGLGNTVYGAVLLAGSLIALGLFRKVLYIMVFCGISGMGYIFISSFIPPSFEPWLSIFINGMVALFYWTVLIFFTPNVRLKVLNVLKLKWSVE